jgi:hypothetical protein
MHQHFSRWYSHLPYPGLPPGAVALLPQLMSSTTISLGLSPFPSLLWCLPTCAPVSCLSVTDSAEPLYERWQAKNAAGTTEVLMLATLRNTNHLILWLATKINEMWEHCCPGEQGRRVPTTTTTTTTKKKKRKKERKEQKKKLHHQLQKLFLLCTLFFSFFSLSLSLSLSLSRFLSPACDELSISAPEAKKEGPPPPHGSRRRLPRGSQLDGTAAFHFSACPQLVVYKSNTQ